MKKINEEKTEGTDSSYQKKPYEAPRMEEHEPLEVSTAVVYYYYQ